MPTIHAPLDPRLESDAAALSEALSGLLRVVQFRDRGRAYRHGLSASQGHALAAATQQGPLTVNQLAAALYLDKSTASRLAAALEERGYLRRERAERDGRIVRLVATPEGRALWARIDGDVSDEYGELLTDFDPEVRAAMTRMLGRLAASFAARVETTGGTCSRAGGEGGRVSAEPAAQRV